MSHGPISKTIWASLPTKLLVIGRTLVVPFDSLPLFQYSFLIDHMAFGPLLVRAGHREGSVVGGTEVAGVCASMCTIKQENSSPLCAPVCSSHYSLKMTSSGAQMFSQLSII